MLSEMFMQMEDGDLFVDHLPSVWVSFVTFLGGINANQAAILMMCFYLFFFYFVFY